MSSLNLVRSKRPSSRSSVKSRSVKSTHSELKLQKEFISQSNKTAKKLLMIIHNSFNQLSLVKDNLIKTLMCLFIVNNLVYIESNFSKSELFNTMLTLIHFYALHKLDVLNTESSASNVFNPSAKKEILKLIEKLNKKIGFYNSDIKAIQRGGGNSDILENLFSANFNLSGGSSSDSSDSSEPNNEFVESRAPQLTSKQRKTVLREAKNYLKVDEHSKRLGSREKKQKFKKLVIAYLTFYANMGSVMNPIGTPGAPGSGFSFFSYLPGLQTTLMLIVAVLVLLVVSKLVDGVEKFFTGVKDTFKQGWKGLVGLTAAEEKLQQSKNAYNQAKQAAETEKAEREFDRLKHQHDMEKKEDEREELQGEVNDLTGQLDSTLSVKEVTKVVKGTLTEIMKSEIEYEKKVEEYESAVEATIDEIITANKAEKGSFCKIWSTEACESYPTQLFPKINEEHRKMVHAVMKKNIRYTNLFDDDGELIISNKLKELTAKKADYTERLDSLIKHNEKLMTESANHATAISSADAGRQRMIQASTTLAKTAESMNQKYVIDTDGQISYVPLKAKVPDTSCVLGTKNCAHPNALPFIKEQPVIEANLNEFISYVPPDIGITSVQQPVISHQPIMAQIQGRKLSFKKKKEKKKTRRLRRKQSNRQKPRRRSQRRRR